MSWTRLHHGKGKLTSCLRVSGTVDPAFQVGNAQGFGGSAVTGNMFFNILSEWDCDTFKKGLSK